MLATNTHPGGLLSWEPAAGVSHALIWPKRCAEWPLVTSCDKSPSLSGNDMLFTKRLRDLVKRGEVTASVRIWQTPHVKVGGTYRLEEGHIVVTSIREIAWEDLTDQLARDTGFKNLVDLMKTAKHGAGQTIYYIKFEYAADPARPSAKKQTH
jgi:hypothetical protein